MGGLLLLSCLCNLGCDRWCVWWLEVGGGKCWLMDEKVGGGRCWLVDKRDGGGRCRLVDDRVGGGRCWLMDEKVGGGRCRPARPEVNYFPGFGPS